MIHLRYVTKDTINFKELNDNQLNQKLIKIQINIFNKLKCHDVKFKLSVYLIA